MKPRRETPQVQSATVSVHWNALRGAYRMRASPEFFFCLKGYRLGSHHQERWTHRRNPAPGVLFILFEAPSLALRREQHELAAVELPGDRAEARDQRIAARLDDQRE